MRLHVLIPAMAAALLALSGCIKEKEMAGEVPQMTITVSMPDDAVTKAAFSVPGSEIGLHLAWQADDQIRVISGSNSAVYDIQPGFTDHTATFTGPVVAGEEFDIVCPATFASVEEAQVGNVNLTQDGNGSTSHLVFTAKLGNVAKEDLPNIGFTDEWVASHAGTTLNMGGIVKLVLTLPDELTAPKRVVLSGIGDDIAVNITGVDLTSEHVLTAYAQSSWEDIPILSGTEFTVSVTGDDESVFTSTKTIPADATLLAGTQNIIKVVDGFEEQLFAGGDGTQANPYLIANAKQLDNMHADGVLLHGEKVYFRITKDIDMQTYLASHDWVPLNMNSPYDFGVELDGDDHVIDHLTIITNSTNKNLQTGFFGVLYGSVHDLTFTNATINNTYGKPTGILCGYCGYNGEMAHVFNVHVNGTVTYNSSLSGADGSGGVGGLAGRIHTCLIESCSAFDINLTSAKQYAGGLFGYDWNAGATVRNCFTSGSVTGNGQRAGAIAGALIKMHTTILNCYSTAEVHAPRAVGGIAGYCNLDSSAGKGYETNMPYNIISGCIAWQTQLRTNTYNGEESTNNFWSSGAIASGTATHNILSNCWRRSDLDFRDYSAQFTLYDQDDANAATPLVVYNPDPDIFKNYYPYHGKAADPGETLSHLAKRIGWSEVAWNLDGPVPELTGVVESVAPASGASGVTPGSAGTGPKYPTASMDGWTVTSIEDGITYYTYDNKDFYSSGAASARSFDKYHQNVFIIDVDLNNPNYKVKLVHSSPTAACSQVYKATGAIAAINAGYEASSIAIKVNTQYSWTKMDDAMANNELDNIASESVYEYPIGMAKSYMPNNTITDTGVPNWKSQGTVYFDGERGIRMAYDSYDPAKAPGSAGNPPVKSVFDERLFYQFNTDNEIGLLSSAPVLIENYNKVGTSFTSWYPQVTGESSEAPYSHQNTLAPRTAVALNADNHLLLIVVDGRYAASVGGQGMGALSLTRFISYFFNSQYALNLDGGGSTTMCVKGKGDSTTNVVNYPGDNRTQTGHEHDHEGQRARDTFIVVVPANPAE